jgi:hypothetical protein
MYCGAASLLIVIKGRKQLEDGGPHQGRDLRHIRGDGKALGRDGPVGPDLRMAGLRDGCAHAP